MDFKLSLSLFSLGFSIFVSIIGFTLWFYERNIEQIKEEVS